MPMATEPKAYEDFLNTISRPAWERIGITRRAGVAVGLFSVYSQQSSGIGDFADIRLLLDWCRKTRLGILQLLPLNDTGSGFRPYDAQSSFALDAMYLSLENLTPQDIAEPFHRDIKKLKKEFSLAGKQRVDYRVKKAKLEILWKIFAEKRVDAHEETFEAFIRANAFWLEDYCLFKVIKEKNNEMSWEGWSPDLKDRRGETLSSFKETYHENILFHQWLQWQLYEQLKDAHAAAQESGILIMGDLPFLVSRDSADVWAHQEYFKLSHSAGAPPDALYSLGQRWGMPPYNWDNVSRRNFDYLVEKLKYAQNFYDLYRIDHSVGAFRVWTIPLSEPLEHGGRHGFFDPKEEHTWERHGRRLLEVMVKNTSMLACAEDLGVIPECSFKVLKEFGIPGIDIQRWIREWGTTYDFRDPARYRKNAVATVATHDMTNLLAWWLYEASTVDGELIARKLREKNIPFENIRDRLFDMQNASYGRLRWKQEIKSPAAVVSVLGRPEHEIHDILDIFKASVDEKERFLEFLGLEKEPDNISLLVKKSLEKILEAGSVFSIQLLHDWLSLDSLFKGDPWNIRINTPGTLSDRNWSLLMPLPLEDILELPVNAVIKELVEESARSASHKQKEDMMKTYLCKICGYVAFDEAPEKCPVCNALKQNFLDAPDIIKKPGSTQLGEPEKKHIPTITVVRKCGLIPEGCVDAHVKVGEIEHPMTQEHSITFIDFYLDKKFIARVHLTPGHLHPAAALHLKAEKGILTAVEKCNLHGHWMSEAAL